MKRFYFILTATLFSFGSLWAQEWQTLGNNIYNTNIGNVGIGTDTPYQKLSIIDGQLFIGRTSVNQFESGRIRFSEYLDSFRGAFIHYNGSTNRFNIGVHDALDSDINNDLNAISILRSNGRVGIGTASPAYKLDVNGHVRANYLIMKAENNALEGGEILLEGAGEQNPWHIDNYAGNFRLHHSGYSYFHVMKNGNVGIGTYGPDAKLTVKGDIHAREVRVDLNGAVAPDFVFEPDYNLRSLEATEAYIKANKHLPEIPSAAEMEEKGIQLKEMNLKLLQKVEELTLYTIKQQKLIEKLAIQNEKLMERIETLENK